MFGKKKEPEAPVVTEEIKLPEIPQPKPVEKPADPFAKPAPATKIGPGITMIGNFDTKDPVEIYGTLRGNIRSTSSVAISKNGALIGEAALDSMKVEGRIDGTVLCNTSAEFSGTGSMKGNLSTGTLKTQDGALFEGKLSMLPPRKEAPKPVVKEESRMFVKAPAEEAVRVNEDLTRMSLQEAFGREKRDAEQ